MENIKFLSAKDVSTILGISVTSAYKIIKSLNNDLQKQGKIVISGKISKRYFEEKVYL